MRATYCTYRGIGTAPIRQRRRRQPTAEQFRVVEPNRMRELSKCAVQVKRTDYVCSHSYVVSSIAERINMRKLISYLSSRRLITPVNVVFFKANEVKVARMTSSS